MRRACWLASLACFLLAACPATPEALPAEGRIVVSITPGKPGAPTEAVTITWHRGGARVRAERRAAGGEVMAEGEATLAGDRLRKLWHTIEQHRLVTFAPRETAGQVFDFGVRHVHLEWATRPGQASGIHAFSWSAPLDNDAAIAPLVCAAGRTARAAVPNVLLAYFPD